METDPLILKLSDYLNSRLSVIDNVATQRLTAEIKDVVEDVSLIDTIRPFTWSKADETRLDQLNIACKSLS